MCDSYMEFPTIVRLREKVISELPTSGIFIAQPVGKQCYVWFTDQGCFFVDVYQHAWKVEIAFDPALRGTVLLGTIVHYEQVKTILVYDIYYKQGVLVSAPFLTRWNLIIELLLTYVRQHESQYYIMMPHMSLTSPHFEPLYKMYSVKVVQEDAIYHKLEQDKKDGKDKEKENKEKEKETKENKEKETKEKEKEIKENKEKRKEKPTFMVRSTPKSDIYMIFKHGEFDSYACINTLSTSEYMNSIFHKDSLEKEFRMECDWSETYKKWIPVKLK